MTDLDKMFNKLLKESQRGIKKKEKKKQTMAEARAAREKRTAGNLLRIKTKINKSLDKLVEGSFTRECMTAVVVEEVCGCCRARQKVVKNIEVWSKSTVRADIKQRTTEVLTHGMYEFHSDLPLKLRFQTKYIPACASCIVAKASSLDKANCA